MLPPEAFIFTHTILLFMHRYLALAFIPAMLVSCDSNSSEVAKSAPDATASLKAAYSLAIQYGDTPAAATLAYQLVATEPAEAGKHKEEIAKTFLATGRHRNCLAVLADLVTNHGGADKLSNMEMSAYCHEALGDKENALAAWSVVWPKTQDAIHAVRLAGLHFELGQLDETDTIIAAGLAVENAKTAVIPLPKTREMYQNIPAAAALHNLKALSIMKRDPKSLDAARAELNAALALFPEFELAKRNLAGLSQPAEPPTDAAAPESATPPESAPAPPEGAPAPPEGAPAPPEGAPAPPEGVPAPPEGAPAPPVDEQ
jgi:hypothetical protein